MHSQQRRQQQQRQGLPPPQPHTRRHIQTSKRAKKEAYPYIFSPRSEYLPMMPSLNSTDILTRDEDAVLPASFRPGPKHVVCMRGNLFWEHEGNRMYRKLIKEAIPKYSVAPSRVEKSRIVSQIIEAVYCGDEKGAFVKRSPNGLTWIECTNDFVREKIGQSLRDGLAGRYKSSTKAKKRRCKELQSKMSNSLETIVQSRKYVHDTMSRVTKRIKLERPVSDDHYHSIFLQANSCLLQSIKTDQTILGDYRKAFTSI